MLAACGGGSHDLSSRLGRQIVAGFEPESITVDAGDSATADLALRCEDVLADGFEVQRVEVSDTRIRTAGLDVNANRECATATADPDVNTARLRVGIQVDAGLAPGRYTLDVIVVTVGEAFADSTSARLTIIVRAPAGSNLLLDPDFEQTLDVGAVPTGPGSRRGDVATVVTDENDIASHADARMLKFIATGNVSSTNTVASQQWQIVGLEGHAADIAAGRNDLPAVRGLCLRGCRQRRVRRGVRRAPRGRRLAGDQPHLALSPHCAGDVMSPRCFTILRRAAAGLTLCLGHLAAAAQPARVVVVNGSLLDSVSIAQLDRAACSRVPDGRYWLNLHTGQWGYAGEPWVRGHIGDACRPAAPSQPSLSERGRLYRPGEILNGR